MSRNSRAMKAVERERHEAAMREHQEARQAQEMLARYPFISPAWMAQLTRDLVLSGLDPVSAVQTAQATQEALREQYFTPPAESSEDDAEQGEPPRDEAAA